MKELAFSLFAIICFSASAFAQGTMLTVDNINGMGGPHATSFGRFFNVDGQPCTRPSINIEVLGGPSASSLSLIVALTGANALVYSGTPGIFLDPTGSTYNVPGVSPGATTTLQVRAWRGSAPTYTSAIATEQYWAWTGSAFVSADTFTFSNPTGGGGTPPGVPKSLDGMPAMQVLVCPEPSTTALVGLGAVAMLVLRGRSSRLSIRTCE